MDASKAKRREGRAMAPTNRLLTAFLALVVCCGLASVQPAFADVRAFKVEGGVEDADFVYADGVLTVKSETPMTVSMVDPDTESTDHLIVVDPGEGRTAHVTINDVRTKKGLVVEMGALDLMLERENVFYTGIQNGDNPLVISGAGSLFAQGDSYNAGIGGRDGQTGSNITIAGGKIVAYGGYLAAGIGGGYLGDGSNITITGGSVTAIGGMQAAGIGGGRRGNGLNVTVSGGEVVAEGGEFAAGIGGGDYDNILTDCANGANITIANGTVTATGGYFAAGIGGGYGGALSGNGHGMDIAVRGGEVTARGGDFAAGIGGSGYSDGKGIAISGGTVTAQGGSEGAGIGGAITGNGSGISISGGTVTATGGDFAAGIGGGSGLDNNIRPCSGGRGSNIAIAGGLVAAIPGQTSDHDYAQGTVIRPIAQAIGSGYGSLTYGDSSITGGFFADEARDWEGNKVYGLVPAVGFAAAENREEATKDAFPVRVLPVATLEVRADVQHVCDGSAVAASEVVSTARYGDADALDAVAFEHREAGRSDWKAGLPEDVGTYRVRATLPEGADAGGALYAAVSAETDLAIVSADGAGRTGDPADGSPAPAERRGGAPAATGDPAGALALIALACAVSAAALLRTASRRR